MITFEETEFLSKFHQVPVVIETYQKKHVPDSQNSLKFLVSGNMTVSQLVYIVRHRMKLSLDHGFNLLFNKGRTLVMMSQRLGEIASKYKDPKGILRFIFAAQNTFGCRVPRTKPIKSIFPGIEPNPFGAPEPSLWFDETILGPQVGEDEILIEMSEYVYAHLSTTNNPQGEDVIQFPESNVGSPFMPYVSAHSSTTTNLQQMDLVLEPLPAVGSGNSTQTGSTSVVYTYTPSAASYDSVPMEVSEQSNIFQQALSTLQHSLDQFVPFSQTQFVPQLQPHATVLDSWAHAPLVTSLHQLMEALQNHLSVASYSPISSLFSIPFSMEILNNSATLGHVPIILPSDTMLHTLQLANQAMEAVLRDLTSPTPSPLGSTSDAIFSALILYFQQVTVHVEHQTSAPSEAAFPPSPLPYLTSLSADASQHNSSTGIGLANLVSAGVWSSSATVGSFLNNVMNLYSSDSDSSEEDAAECFCDILL